MTLEKFDQLLKEINPLLHIRQKGHGDVVGLFLGNEYISRMSKGEMPLNGYRHRKFNAETMQYEIGIIAKRGRMTLTRILEARGVIRGPRDRAKLIWGV